MPWLGMDMNWENGGLWRFMGLTDHEPQAFPYSELVCEVCDVAWLVKPFKGNACITVGELTNWTSLACHVAGKSHERVNFKWLLQAMLCVSEIQAWKSHLKDSLLQAATFSEWLASELWRHLNIFWVHLLNRATVVQLGMALVCLPKWTSQSLLKVEGLQEAWFANYKPGEVHHEIWIMTKFMSITSLDLSIF